MEVFSAWEGAGVKPNKCLAIVFGLPLWEALLLFGVGEKEFGYGYPNL
jgi:hypothetical protein